MRVAFSGCRNCVGSEPGAPCLAWAPLASGIAIAATASPRIPSVRIGAAVEIIASAPGRAPSQFPERIYRGLRRRSGDEGRQSSPIGGKRYRVDLPHAPRGVDSAPFAGWCDRMVPAQPANSSNPADPAEIEELLEQHLPALRAFVRLRMGPTLRSKESASDLVQSACREVLENADRYRFQGDENFKRWLFTTALRVVKNKAKFWQREKRDAGREVRQRPRSTSFRSGSAF